MSTTKQEILARLPDDAGEILSRFFSEIGAAYSDEKAAIAAKFATKLLLPRFAGTMLKFLCEKSFAAQTLCTLAAEFQDEDPRDRRTQFRLTVALEYLSRTGCVRSLNGELHMTDFGKEVYQDRFPKAQ